MVWPVWLPVPWLVDAGSATDLEPKLVRGPLLPGNEGSAKGLEWKLVRGPPQPELVPEREPVWRCLA